MRLLPLLAVATLLGCQSLSPDESHTAGMADAGFDAADASSPLCPATVPALGSVCTSPAALSNGPFAGLYCEYGDAWWSINCDTVVVCSGSSWATATAIDTFAACSPEPAPNAAACPASPGYADRGMACPEAGLTCYYGTGASCLCSDDGDAGTVWSCQPDEPGCPTARPRVGSPCATASPNCYYGHDGFGTVCVGGVWQVTYYGTSAEAGP